MSNGGEKVDEHRGLDRLKACRASAGNAWHFNAVSVVVCCRPRIQIGSRNARGYRLTGTTQQSWEA
jgi:hypothetical protein